MSSILSMPSLEWLTPAVVTLAALFQLVPLVTRPHLTFPFLLSFKLICLPHPPFSWWLPSRNNWYLACQLQSLQWRGVIWVMATLRPRCTTKNKHCTVFHLQIPNLPFPRTISMGIFCQQRSECIFWKLTNYNVTSNHSGGPNTIIVHHRIYIVKTRNKAEWKSRRKKNKMGVWYGSAGPFSKGRYRGAAGGILSAGALVSSWGGCAPPTVVCTILLIGHCYHLGRRAPGEHGVHVPLQSPAVFFHICHWTQQSVD